MASITLPVQNAGDYDVIVIGGGLSGCCAAIASARTGARTLLAESLPYFGGNGLIGLPISSYNAAFSPHRIVGGIPWELHQRLAAKGAIEPWRDNPEDWQCVDCEQLQIELTHLFDEAGVELLAHSPLLAVEKEGRRLTSAVFYNKETPLRYTAKVLVDSTGDAQVAALAGLPTPMGRARDGKTQPMTMTFQLGGVDGSRKPRWGEVNALWRRLGQEHPWLNPRDGGCAASPIPGKPGVYFFNVTRILVDKGTDHRQLTQAEKTGRYQVEEYVEKFLRPHVAGFERCYLTQLGCRVGVRETRRIVGLHELTAAELRAQTRFPDAVACNSYPVDIHSPDGGGTHFEHGKFASGAYYTIPYRSLVARDADNLLASGRCLSASHEALAAVRVLSAAMATGEAAGTAAALCSRDSLPAAHLPPARLLERLQSQGAFLGEPLS